MTKLDYGGYLSNWGGSDHPEMVVFFLDDNSNELDNGIPLDTYNSTWTLVNYTYPIPAETRKVKMVLMGTRFSGEDNDSYFDDIFLKVWQSEDCMNTVIQGDLNQDGTLNILDIVIIVNIILGSDDFELLADMNEDGIVNILDVITLINTILDR